MPRVANRRTGKPFTEPNDNDIASTRALARKMLAAEQMYEVLIKVLERLDTSRPIYFAFDLSDEIRSALKAAEEGK